MQFIDNYRIYKARVWNPYATYEKGDMKYAFFRFIMYLIPSLVVMGIIFYMIVHLPVKVY